MNTGAFSAAGPAWARGRSTASAASADELARLRRAARLPGRPARRQPQLVHRLHAGRLPGHRASATAKRPFSHLDPPPNETRSAQRAKLDFVQELNRRHRAERRRRHRPRSAHRRPTSWPIGCSRPRRKPSIWPSETEETQRLYGLDDKTTERIGRNCLLARRLVERGVRFVQLYCGSGSKWDAHSDVEGNHARYCRESDKPIAGLLKDLSGAACSTRRWWSGAASSAGRR